MMKKLVFIIYCFLFFTTVEAQDFSLYKKEYLIEGKDTLPYRILLPANYNPSSKYALILFLHGSGERGSDNEKQLSHGGDLFLKEDLRSQYSAIVIFPQCPEGSSWANISSHTDSAGKKIFEYHMEDTPTVPMKLLQSLLVKTFLNYPVDKKRIYAGGLSMGGFGTFELVSRNPNLFAAAFPICGGAEPSLAKKLRKPAWWVFHGAKDNVVPPENSERIVQALKDKNASVKFTLYPEAMHNSWDNAFAEPTLMAWLFSNHKQDRNRKD